MFDQSHAMADMLRVVADMLGDEKQLPHIVALFWAIIPGFESIGIGSMTKTDLFASLNKILESLDSIEAVINEGQENEEVVI